MAHSQHEMVDLLEIYHARNLREQLRRELRRLRLEEGVLGLDPQRRREVYGYYESMLIATTELLYCLGDGTPA
jgi:hypothetical protein